MTCDRQVKDATTVNPTGEVNQPVSQVVCNGTTLLQSILQQSTREVSTFTWTNNNISIGLGASGIGDIPSFVALNPGNAPVVCYDHRYPSFY